jgi:ATP-dependent protease Clp ATPase subunit
MQRRLQELLRASFATPAPSPVEPVSAPKNSDSVPQAIRDFHLTPKDIKKHLDRFVIRQDEAKKVLGIAVCDHYNNARVMASRPSDAPPLEYSKQNVLLAGPTGVGKTYLVKHVAELIGVPFVKADATKFSETGYVGGDVDDLVRELVQKADGDPGLAQYGIILHRRNR